MTLVCTSSKGHGYSVMVSEHVTSLACVRAWASHDDKDKCGRAFCGSHVMTGIAGSSLALREGEHEMI